MEKIKLSANKQTEYLLQLILDNLSEAEIELIDDIERENESLNGFAGEPITTGIIITASVSVLVIIARIIERAMENKKQIEVLNIITSAPDAEYAKIIKDVAINNNNVSISWGLTTRRTIDQE